jgi:hypothetical protein
MFEGSELSFHRRTTPVQIAPPLRLARDERLHAGSLDPPGLRSALPGRAAPIGRAALEVGTGKRPSAVLAGRGKMIAAPDERGLAKWEDRYRTALGAGVVHRPVVVALVHRDRLDGEAACAEGVEQAGYGGCLMLAGGLDFPRERQPGHGADRGVDAIAIEPAAFADADRGAVSPRGIRVAEPLAVRAVLTEGSLPISLCGHVRSVDCHVAAHVGKLIAERVGNASEAGVQQRPLLAEFRGETVHRPLRGSAADSRLESMMLSDQRSHARPRRDCVQRLHEARADEGASAVTLATVHRSASSSAMSEATSGESRISAISAEGATV